MKTPIKMMSLALLLCLSHIGFAQVTVSHVENMNNDVETEIAMKDAPQALVKALSSNDYEGWEAKKIMHIQKGDKEYYKVKFKKGDEKMYQKFNKDGTVKMDKDWKKDKSKNNKSSK